MLCYEEILAEKDAGNIKIDPFDIAQLNPNSYDVRLGNWFIRVGVVGFDPTYFDLYYAPDGCRFPIVPYTTTLGLTKEVVGAKNQIVHQLRSKSSTRRRGITVCDDAGFGDIGYSNHWTVELVAHVPSSVALTVGEPFGQIVFDRTGQDTSHPYVGQYNKNDWPICMVPKLHREHLIPFFADAQKFVNEKLEKLQPVDAYHAGIQHFRFRDWSLLSSQERVDHVHRWVEPYYL